MNSKERNALITGFVVLGALLLLGIGVYFLLDKGILVDPKLEEVIV